MAKNITLNKLPLKIDLYEEFPLPSYDEWKDQVIKDLKGESFDKKLLTKTYEEITLKPIYTKSDFENLEHVARFPNEKNWLRASSYEGTTLGWVIAQEILTPSAKEYNEILKDYLTRGQNSVVLTLDISSIFGIPTIESARQYGVSGTIISNLADMEVAFSGINFEKYPLIIDCCLNPLAFVSMLYSYFQKTKFNMKKLRGRLNFDMYGCSLKYGIDIPLPKDASQSIAEAVKFCKVNAPNFSIIGISGNILAEAGCNAIQELAYSFATAVDYLHQISDSEISISVDSFFKTTSFKFSADTNYFLEIAKLRAARFVWQRIAKEYEVLDVSTKIWVKTSLQSHSKLDPYVNMLKTTTETFASVLGGADCITSHPFDAVFGTSDEFSRRIARNTQIILKEEAHLDKVIDPAGGSFYIEWLTNELIKKVWKLFGEITEIGMFDFLHKKGIADINKLKSLREKEVTTRKNILTGTNLYANIKEEIKPSANHFTEEMLKLLASTDETILAKRNIEKTEKTLNELRVASKSKTELQEYLSCCFEEYATMQEVMRVLDEGTNKFAFPKLNFDRLSRPFEKLREEVKSFTEKHNRRPKVFLVLMGNSKNYKARADFAKGYFETGGFEVVYPDKGFENVDTAAKAFQLSLSEVAVICSSDDLYLGYVPALCSKIKSKRIKCRIILAGKPVDYVATFQKAGIYDFIFLGSDVIAVLSKLVAEIGDWK